MISALKEAGGKPFYTEYEGVGHDSWVRAYADPKLMEWLFAQKLKREAP
jgi:predicted peptidase